MYVCLFVCFLVFLFVNFPGLPISASWLAFDVKLVPLWFKKTTTSQPHPKAKKKITFFFSPISFYQEENLSQKSLPENIPRRSPQGPLTRRVHMAKLKLQGGRENKHWNFHLYSKKWVLPAELGDKKWKKG